MILFPIIIYTFDYLSIKEPQKQQTFSSFALPDVIDVVDLTIFLHTFGFTSSFIPLVEQLKHVCMFSHITV